MALHWNVTEITAREGEAFVWPKDEHGEQRLNGLVECVIWATMFVGLPTITDANAEEFAVRLAQWEHGLGCLSTRGTPITPDEVRRCIGLTTNASSHTRAKFHKQLAEAMERNARDRVRRLATSKKEA